MLLLPAGRRLLLECLAPHAAAFATECMQLPSALPSCCDLGWAALLTAADCWPALLPQVREAARRSVLTEAGITEPTGGKNMVGAKAEACCCEA